MKHTLGEVRIALDAIGDKDAAIEIVRTVGGVAALSKLSENKFDDVIRAANARARRSEAPHASHPATKASRDVNEDSMRFWEDWKAAQKSNEASPPIPSDPGGHNARELEKLGRERSDFEQFVGNGRDG